MIEINLLKSLPKGKRDIKSRNNFKTREVINKSCEFGELYFDGPREG